MTSINAIILRHGAAAIIISAATFAIASLKELEALRARLAGLLNIEESQLIYAFAGLLVVGLSIMFLRINSKLQTPVRKLVKLAEANDTYQANIGIRELDSICRVLERSRADMAEQENDFDEMQDQIDGFQQKLDDQDKAIAAKSEAIAEKQYNIDELGRRNKALEDKIASVSLFQSNDPSDPTAAQTLDHEQAERTLWIAKVGHQLRAPIDFIRKLSKNLIENWDQNPLARIHQDVSDISRFSSDQLEVLDRAIELAKIEAHAEEPRAEVVRIRSLADDIAHLMNRRLEGDSVAWNLDYRVDAKAAIETDRQWLRTILDNLLDNAIGHTTQGLVELTIERHGEKLVFTVNDTGCGIDGDETSRIFEHFYQSNRNQIRNTGAGLGLPIARSLAERLGGNISVSSKPSQGSKFIFEYTSPTFIELSEEDPQDETIVNGSPTISEHRSAVETIPESLLGDVRSLAAAGKTNELSRLIELRFKRDYPMFALGIRERLFQQDELLEFIDSLHPVSQ